MDKDTAEGETISERTFDILDRTIIIIIQREFVSKFTTNSNRMCIKLVRNTNFIGVTPIFISFVIGGCPQSFSCL